MKASVYEVAGSGIGIYVMSVSRSHFVMPSNCAKQLRVSNDANPATKSNLFSHRHAVYWDERGSHGQRIPEIPLGQAAAATYFCARFGGMPNADGGRPQLFWRYPSDLVRPKIAPLVRCSSSANLNWDVFSFRRSSRAHPRFQALIPLREKHVNPIATTGSRWQ